ncbi:MAG: leucine-rich repeat domain-containing protein, partial [Bacteroidales bacterium]|nr:leucine-rich repeat domain-containing protein [Bacteroidales bacterium]
MNKSKSLQAVLTAVLTLVATTASAHSFEVNDIYYNDNGDGTVSVTYKGRSYTQYADIYTGKVVIPPSITISKTGTTYSVTSIGSYAFYYCSLTSITIPNSVTSIDDRAFWGCGLTSINIPNSVSSIGESAFWGSDLTSINIPNSVSSIGDRVFSFCRGLKSIVVESGNSKYDSRDNCNAIIETATNTLLAGCKNTTIHNSVTSIGNSAFSGCSGLTSVTIPNSVNSIGYAAFSGCSGLESIVVESRNSKYDSRDNCNAIIETATNTLLAGCKNTTIPNSVTSIGN